MMKFNGLDVYDITLRDDDIGIKATSLVSVPATDSVFLHFNEDRPQFMFADEEKRELVGAIMIPDRLIYRNINGHKFYVNFTKEIIKNLTSKMIKSGTAGLFTVQHKYKADEDDIVVQEVWIKESDTDKSMAFGIDEVVGTAFMKVKVNNDNIWNQIKNNGLNGFSIELDASIVEKNELLFNKEEKKEIKMTISDVFSNAIEVNGTSLHFNSELTKNTYLVMEGEDGKPVPYTGEFNYNEVIYKVENGVVTDFEDVKLTTKEAIESLSSEFNEIKESIKSMFESKEAIEQKEEELRLLRTQFEDDKAAFTKLKEAGFSKVSVNLSKSISDAGNSGKSWMKKFV